MFYLMTKIERHNDGNKQIELAAENLARILIQQIMNKRDKQINKKKEN